MVNIFKTFLLSLGLCVGLQAGHSDTPAILADRVQAVVGQAVTVKMPPKLQPLFLKTLLAVAKDGDKEAEKVFLQQHLPLLTGNMSKEYKQSLHEKESKYAVVIGAQRQRVQKLISLLHTKIDQVSARWLTWKKAAVIGALTALAIGGGVMWHNRQQKRNNAARIIQRVMARNMRERKIQAAMILEKEDLISAEEKTEQAQLQSPFYLESDVAGKMRTVAEQIAAGNFKQQGFRSHTRSDVIPTSWKGQDGIYRSGDVMIKTHRRPGWNEKQLPKQNVRRALAAFRVNNVAPTIHALRVQRREVPSVGDNATELMPVPENKKGKTILGRTDLPQLKEGEWRTHAVTTRLVPLPRTITPAQAKKDGTRPSPIDDRHYVVLEQAVPVDHVNRRKLYRGGRPSSLGEAVAQQVVTAAHLAGTDDLHASNVIPTDATDKESDVTLIDLEQHRGSTRGERPSRKEVVKSLLEQLFYRQQPGLRGAFERMDNNNARPEDIEQKVREDRIAYGKERLKFYKEIKEYVREHFFNKEVSTNDAYKALRGQGHKMFKSRFMYDPAMPQQSVQNEQPNWNRDDVLAAFQQLLNQLPALYQREDLVDTAERQEVLRKWRSGEDMTDDDYLVFAHTPSV